MGRCDMPLVSVLVVNQLHNIISDALSQIKKS